MSKDAINPSVAGISSVSSDNRKREQDQNISSLKRSVIDNFPHSKFSALTRHPLIQLFFYETLAMFVFVFGIACIKEDVAADSMITVAVFIAICISASLSGANVNTSITFSQCLRKQNKYRWKMLGIYLIAQVFGTLLGLGLGQLLNGPTIPPFVPDTHDAIGFIRIILSEAIGTFILIFFILLVTNPNTTFIQDQISGYLFIATFVHMGRCFAPSSKKCINFVIAFGASVFAATNGDWSGFEYIGFWIIGQILGSIGATLFYDYFFEPNVEFLRTKKRESESFEYKSLCQLQDENKKDGQKMEQQD